MSTVYVVQEIKDTRQFVYDGDSRLENPNYGAPLHDLTPAAVYGDLEVVVTAQRVGIALQPQVAKIRQKLRNFSDDDYLLLVGDPVLIGICTAVASEFNRGRVSALRWDRRAREYVKVSFDTRKTLPDST